VTTSKLQRAQSTVINSCVTLRAQPRENPKELFCPIKFHEDENEQSEYQERYKRHTTVLLVEMSYFTPRSPL